MSVSTSAYCPQCDREVRVSEGAAFGGADRLRQTLVCGHVVARHDVEVGLLGSSRYPYRARCSCSWESPTYVALHAAQGMADWHLAGGDRV